MSKQGLGADQVMPPSKLGNHGGAVHALEGLAYHVHSGDAAIGTLAGGREKAMAAAKLGKRIVVNN